MIVIQNVGHLFSQEIFNDHSFWNKQLQSYMVKNLSNSRLVIRTFYECLALNLSQDCHQANKKLVYQEYSTYFRNILQKAAPDPIVDIAIVGLGYFASIDSLYSDEDELLITLHLIIQKMNLYYLTQDDDGAVLNVNSFEFLLEHVESICKIIAKLKNIGDDELATLEQMNILIIKTLPNIPKYYHKNASNAFMESLKLIHRSECVALDTFLQAIIYQGM